MIKGIPVVLYEKTPNGVDDFGRQLFIETPVTVENVLVAPVSAEEVVNEMNLCGKELVYKLGIPKGDAHEWENSKVEFFGKTFETFGAITMGIEEMIPLSWHHIIKVYRYE